MKKLKKNINKKNKIGRGIIQFSPEKQSYIEAQLRNIIPGTNNNSNISVIQTIQDARQKEQINRESPKTRAEGSYRNIERRRQSGKTKDQEDTEKDIKLATQPTAWKDAADISNAVGKGLLTTALGAGLISNPLTTLGAIAGGTVGGRAFDKLSQRFTGKTWAENIKDRLGLHSDALPEFFNPGMLLGGLGAGMTGKGIPTLIKMDMPRYGYKPSTQYYFKPGYVGMNYTPIKKLFDFEHWYRNRNPEYVTEQDKKILTEHLPEYKLIQEKALDEGNYMQTSKNFPGSKINKNGEYIFQGDEGSWIQSKSKDFKAKFGDKTLKIGYKGGTDQKAIEGGIQEHAPETFPEQDKGIFFAADKRYADKYNHGNRETPGFWLGFSKPYDMLSGGQRPFLLESEAIRYMRSIDAQPSFKKFPDKPFEVLSNIWGDLGYLKNPEIMEIITKDPNKMTKAELAKRVEILSKIRKGQNNDRVAQFGRMVDANIKSGRWNPMHSTHYDGYIGRDHSLRWSPEYDPMEPFGSHPESYVITKPEQAASLIGNNGAFNGPAYTRKLGGKLKLLKRNENKR